MGAGRPVAESKILSEDEFADLLSTYRHTAFRFEAQPSYAIGEERAELDRFLAGSPLRPSEVPWRRAYLDRIAGQAQTGKRRTRVRVFDEPPTDYQRWLIWTTRWYTAAGEDIRYLPRSQAERIGLPLEADWWLLDDRLVIFMRFTSAGEMAGDELITDPDAIAFYRTWRDAAIAHASPAEQIRAA